LWWRPPKSRSRPGQPLDLVFSKVHDAVDDLAGPRVRMLQLLAWQEEPRDDAGRIGAQPGLYAVRDHSISLIRRACWAVASIASVDSAPWLRLRPQRSRPS
jgi:hypothetical protein